jgi:hypothetical protein
MSQFDLPSLVSELFAAIQLLAGYAPPTIPPEIHQVSRAYMQEEICHSPCQIKAYYDPTRGVYIDRTLDLAGDPFARSILLHELVHHSQAVSGRFDSTSDACTRQNRAEAEAYDIQNRFLMMIQDGHRVSMTGWAMRCANAEVPTPKKTH